MTATRIPVPRQRANRHVRRRPASAVQQLLQREYGHLVDRQILLEMSAFVEEMLAGAADRAPANLVRVPARAPS